MPAPQKVLPGDLFRDMRSGFERHRPLLVRITVAFALLNTIASPLSLAGAAGTALSVGILILLSAGFGGMVTAILCTFGPKETAAEVWAVVSPVLSRLIWVTLIVAASAFAGMFLLIIPGLIIATIFSVATQVVVVERTGTFAAFGRSVELVRGNGWRVFLFLVLLGLCCLALLLLTGLATGPLGTGIAGGAANSFLGNLIVTPLLAIGPAVLFNRLAGQTDTAPGPEQHEDPERHDGRVPDPERHDDSEPGDIPEPRR